MSTLKIEIDLSSATFGTAEHERGAEVDAILRNIILTVAYYDGLDRRIRDSNGNTIGHIRVEP